MKVYIQENRLMLVGKASEILGKLKEYSKQNTTVSEWLQDMKR